MTTSWFTLSARHSAAAALAITIAAASTVGGAAEAQELRSPAPGELQDFLRRMMPTAQPTDLSPPSLPFSRPMEALPVNDPRTESYVQDIRQFLTRQEGTVQLRNQFRLLSADGKQIATSDLRIDPKQLNDFADAVNRWNGLIFWAPASATTDINLRFADQVRAVFGPIPPFDVSRIGIYTTEDGWSVATATTLVEVDGNRVELKPNTDKPNSPLEFEHRDKDGHFVKWTQTVDKCDKPSLAGGVTPCGTASRVSRAVKGNVEWIALARKTLGVGPLQPIPYWTQSDPNYALLGYIGFNSSSGELAFFDGTYEGMRFDWKAPTVAPGGAGYSDQRGRQLASQTYDSTFRIGCVACHDNKEPRIITPYIKQARVGYRDDARAKAFSLDALLPQQTRNSRAPYRTIGTSYTSVHSAIVSGAWSISDPTRTCTGCHGLTNNGTGRFASDAVARLGSLADDDAKENDFRTPWALRSGEGKIHPWMVPEDGNVLSADPPSQEMSDDDWAKLKAVIENPATSPRSLKVYTSTPAPESVATDETRLGDPSGPTNLSVVVASNRDVGASSSARELHISWNYLNSLGDVSTRDDVRFNVAMSQQVLADGSAPPQIGEFPSVEQTIGDMASQVSGGVYVDEGIIVLKDASFVGHQRWTDPSPALVARTYRIDVPAIVGKRYLIRVLPKRYGFDQGGDRYSAVDHTISVDVR